MNDTERHSHSLRPFTRGDGAHAPHFSALPTQIHDAGHFLGEQESLVAQILDAINHPVALCDARAVLLRCNVAWREFGEASRSPWPWIPLGENLLEALPADARVSAPFAVEFAEGMRTVLDGNRMSHSTDFVRTSASGSRNLRLSAIPLHYAGAAKLIITCNEATPREHSAGDLVNDDKTVADLSKLSRREQQILDLVLAGEPNKSIAVILDLSQKTVEKHRSSLMRKLGAQNVVQLVRKVLGHSQSRRL